MEVPMDRSSEDDLIWFFNFAAADAAGLKAAPIEPTGSGGIVDYYPEHKAAHRARAVFVQDALERLPLDDAHVLMRRYTTRGRRESLPIHAELTCVLEMLAVESINGSTYEWLRYAQRKRPAAFGALVEQAVCAVERALTAYRSASSFVRAEHLSEQRRREALPGERVA